MAASSSNHGQKRRDGNKRMEMEEIVRHMSNLPSYLERGKPIQDQALNFGVMDWGRLEKWQYHHHHQKQGLLSRSNKCSPSSSNSSLLFSTDGSSPHSSRGQTSSPTSLKPHRVTLQSSLNVSPDEISSRFVKPCSGNLDKSQDVKDAPLNHSGEKRTTNRSRNKPRGCKTNDLYHQNRHESKSSDDLGSFHTASSSPSSKSKKKMQDELVNELGNFQDPAYGTCDGAMHKTVVLLPRDAPGNSRTNGEMPENIHSDPNNGIPRSFPSETEVINRKNSRNETISDRNSSSPSQRKTTEEKESSFSSKNSIAASKQRSNSPLRRFNFSMSSKSANRTVESPPTSRTHSSPLRRLLDPLFPSKSLEDSTIKTKVKLDLRSCKEVRVDDSHMNKMNESSTTKQALFQIAVKNGRPLFTFAVDNNIDILAATVRSLSGKDDSNGWIYTFFTIHEVKKKKSGWLSQGAKGTAQGYHPNVTAQMKVYNPTISSREFVLSSVGPNRLDHQVLDGQPQDELAAIVVRFLGKADDEEDQDCFSTTVILPGGHHSVPSKGEPSPLIDRWRSGGVCDCGGWDMGCRLRTLTNKVQSNTRSKSPEAHMDSSKFELFFQGEVPNEIPFFSLSPLKEGIFSVEYNSSLSLLHAFSICISVIECRKSCQHTELRTYVAKRVDDDEAPVTYASFPPLSLVERV